jgi:pyruvate dehydrogenase E1 component alpha subunit
MQVREAKRPAAIQWTVAKEPFRVLDLDGHADPTRDPGLAPELLQRMYVGMLRTRLVDDRLTRLQRQGRIGFHVGSLGEEASIVASAAAMREQDWLFPCYREWGAALYRGYPLQRYLDNMYGNADDVIHGRQMPDHITARAQHFGSVTAPIGTQITQAVGFAWAARIKREDLVTAAYFGDGATSSNDFHAGLNFAAVYKTPTVFLLRNNGWAISLPSSQQTATRTYAEKGPGYGVRALRVDGNDALAVYAVVSDAVRHAAQGGGPSLIELVTYRAGPHSTSDDPNAYRQADEGELARDPLLRMKKYLERGGLWSEAQEREQTEEAQRELRACIEAAEHKPPPAIATMFEEVYAELPPHLAQQLAECEAGPRAPKKH